MLLKTYEKFVKGHRLGNMSDGFLIDRIILFIKFFNHNYPLVRQDGCTSRETDVGYR